MFSGMLRKNLVAVLPLIISLIFSRAYADTIVVDPNTKYQVINGWETTTYLGWDRPGDGSISDGMIAAYPNFIDDLVDMMADNGMNRIRLEAFAGMERPTDGFTEYYNGVNSNWSSNDHRHIAINDNSNSNSINSSGFHFSVLDHYINHIVTPLRNELISRGENLWVNLCYVNFEDSNGVHDDPDEYAEFMLAVWKHFDATYGWYPDSIEVILEPDNLVPGTWSGTQIGQKIVATAKKLSDAGYAVPDFVAPSTVSGGNAAGYFDDVVAVPGASNYISEISYHRYGTPSAQDLADIRNRASTYGIRTSMLEWWDGATYETLHEDLRDGRVSAWEQGSISVNAAGFQQDEFVNVDVSNINNPVLNFGDRTRLTRQYFKYVKRGAQRIGASSNTGQSDPLAFINKDGKYTVVVKTDSGRSITINGLPAGTYGIKYTTTSETGVDLSDQNLSNGQSLNTSIPGRGVITVYAKSTGSADTIPPDSPQNLQVN